MISSPQQQQRGSKLYASAISSGRPRFSMHPWQAHITAAERLASNTFGSRNTQLPCHPCQRLPVAQQPATPANPHISRLPPVWQARRASTQSSSRAYSSPAMSSTVGLDAATGSVRHSAACTRAGGGRAGRQAACEAWPGGVPSLGRSFSRARGCTDSGQQVAAEQRGWPKLHPQQGLHPCTAMCSCVPATPPPYVLERFIHSRHGLQKFP